MLCWIALCRPTGIAGCHAPVLFFYNTFFTLKTPYNHKGVT